MKAIHFFIGVTAFVTFFLSATQVWAETSYVASKEVINTSFLDQSECEPSGSRWSLEGFYCFDLLQDSINLKNYGNGSYEVSIKVKGVDSSSCNFNSEHARAVTQNRIEAFVSTSVRHNEVNGTASSDCQVNIDFSSNGAELSAASLNNSSCATLCGNGAKLKVEKAVQQN